MHLHILHAKRTNLVAKWRACAVALVLLVGCCTICSAGVSAAQLRLQRDVHPTGALVVLGDVAEIIANDASEVQRLSAIELFPAPTGTRKRYFDVHELRDLLSQRKIDLANVTFSGASRITIHGTVAERPKAEAPRSIAPALRKRAEHRVRDSVIDHLQRQSGTEGPWTVRFKLSDPQLQMLTDLEAVISAAGGRAPWTGSQSFAIQVDLPEGISQFSLDAIVTLPPAVIVAARPLTRGTMIHEGDVRLDFQSDLRTGDVTFGRLEDVIGLETTQSIAAGEAMVGRQLRKPLLVKAGDAVTVYARSGGIQVRTVARSKESGSLGELVRVESLNDRKSYFARVSGIQKVEVYARAISAGRTILQADPNRRQPQQPELSAAVHRNVRQAIYQEQVPAMDKRRRPSTEARPQEPVTVEPNEIEKPVLTNRSKRTRPVWMGKQTESHAVSNPATPTRLRWTRRSVK